jgi:hypothetical protein
MEDLAFDPKGRKPIEAFRCTRSGHVLLHQKTATRYSKFYKSSGSWTLWLGRTHLATKVYWGRKNQKPRPPREWANNWIRRLENETATTV